MRDRKRDRGRQRETNTQIAVDRYRDRDCLGFQWAKATNEKALGKSWLGMYRGLHAGGAHSDLIVSLFVSALAQLWQRGASQGMNVTQKVPLLEVIMAGDG